MVIENSPLIRVLTILASSIDEQKNYLTKLGTSPSTDELALEYDDAYQLWVSVEDQKTLDPEILCKVAGINTLLDNMSKSADLTIWHMGSLNNPYWSEIRQIAAKTLHDLSTYNRIT